MKRGLTILSQIVFISILSMAGNFVSTYFHLPIPGAILGMFLLFALLSFGIIKLEWCEQGSSLLIGELLLFFIPSAIGIIQYSFLFGATGVKLLGVVLASIVTLLVSVAVITLFVMKFRRKGYRLW